MEQRISLITLGVGDLDRSKRFYEALGWRTESTGEEGVIFFQAGGVVVGLWSRESLAEDCVIDDNGGFGGIALAYNTRSPGEVDDVLAQAERAGGRVARTGADTFWGGYSGVFHDPDGHPWEVAHNPHWTISDDGRTLLRSPV